MRRAGIRLSIVLIVLAATVSQAAERTIELRAWGVPEAGATSIGTLAELRIIERFQEHFPRVKPVATTGLNFQDRTADLVPLMQIAGDIAPHVMYVNFRQSDTYIGNKFLYPLDRYIERDVFGPDEAGRLAGTHLLDADEYAAFLEKGKNYDREIRDRVPHQCWQVMRRRCPYGPECPYLKKWGELPAKDHYHVWCFPTGPAVIALFYRRDLFYEAGLPDRAPATMEEMLEWARRLTNPKEDRYGLKLELWESSWGTLSFLYSTGGRLVARNESGEWRCVFDSPEAVDAYHYVARLFLEPYENAAGEQTGVVYLGGAPRGGGEVKYAMFFDYLDPRFFQRNDPAQWNFGPVPAGPGGQRGSEFNSRMCGIFAGLEDDPDLRGAAWEYIRFFDGPEARIIRARTMVERGLGRFVRAPLLEAAGYPEYVRQIPPGWEEAFQVALEHGIPEPYGKNCQQVYTYASRALDQVRTDGAVGEAIEKGDAAGAKARIREILENRVRRSNEKMLNVLTPEQRRFRNVTASVVASIIVIVFALMIRHVFRSFGRARAEERAEKRKGWQFGRYKTAYLLLIPALATIALWEYYPLVRGTLMAFQDYNARGFSEWTGMENFANVIFDDEFWFSMWVSLKYSLYFVLFGFAAPIALAFLLSEVPRGKVVFRVIYYLPAVLTGVVGIFLWRSFYDQYGMINQVLNFFIHLLNLLPWVHLAEVSTRWLDSPGFALFFCLLPTIWAGMGPGCLIYLAALKTIPEELYEAADVDGAGIMQKVFYVAIPNIRGLIVINFIGAMIGHVMGGSSLVLAMTGGGPYTPYGQTEVVGLHIFWQAFGYLRFGSAVAMAWILGSLLIGFTVLQMKRFSRMEFRAAGGEGK